MSWGSSWPVAGQFSSVEATSLIVFSTSERFSPVRVAIASVMDLKSRFPSSPKSSSTICG